MKDWNKRPKGCKRTVSGMHIPADRVENYQLIVYCSACGLIDDTGKFWEWGHGKPKKIDDSQPPTDKENT